ncbi:ATP-grasp domain-containing protein [Gemmobacter serpentinus]|uniref:hypothetical protein n=1 Tax=Gemmobacter serpentinus TaxID=2652247 RepID=UPI00124D16DA|nr:hypothetical protein [Gemmobacter serpentinus]
MKFHPTFCKAMLIAFLASGVGVSMAAAQSAEPMTCQIFEGPNFTGNGGTIVGNDVVMFHNQGAGDDLLPGLTGLRHFYDPQWSKAVSSMRAGAGCAVGIGLLENGKWSFVESRTEAAKFGVNSDNMSDAAYCDCR